MPKKLIVIIIAVLMVIAVVVVLKNQTPKINTNIATLKNITQNKNKIACEDAKWLLDTNLAMISQVLSQIEEETEGEVTNEQLMHIAEAINSSEAQAKIVKWHEDVLDGIRIYYKGDEKKQLEVRDQIGTEYLRLYQAAMAINLELMGEAETRSALDEEYCR